MNPRGKHAIRNNTAPKKSSIHIQQKVEQEQDTKEIALSPPKIKSKGRKKKSTATVVATIVEEIEKKISPSPNEDDKTNVLHVSQETHHSRDPVQL